MERKRDSEYAIRILNIAREELSCSYPFLAPAIYALNTVEDADGTVSYGLSQNADAFLYSPEALVEDFVRGKDISSVFLHSVLHCVFLHPFFVPFYRDKQLWDLACDICIFDIISSLNRNREVTDSESKALPVLARLKRKMPLLNAQRVYSLLEKSDVSPQLFYVDDHHLWNASEEIELNGDLPLSDDPEGFRRWVSIAGKVELSLDRTLIGDHMLRVRAAAGGFHAFPVQARVDQHPGTGFRLLCRPADGPEGARGAAVVLVRRGGILRADVEFPRPLGLLLPEFKATTVRKQGGKVLFHHMVLLVQLYMSFGF